MSFNRSIRDLQSGGRLDRGEQLGMMFDVVLRAGQESLGRSPRRVQLAQDRRQVVIDQEGEAQLVGSAVDAAPLVRVLLQPLEVNQQCFLGLDRLAVSALRSLRPC